MGEHEPGMPTSFPPHIAKYWCRDPFSPPPSEDFCAVNADLKNPCDAIAGCANGANACGEADIYVEMGLSRMRCAAIEGYEVGCDRPKILGDAVKSFKVAVLSEIARAFAT